MKVPEAWIPHNRRPMPREATHRNSKDKKKRISQQLKTSHSQQSIVQSTPALRTPSYNGHPIIRTAAKSPAKTNYRRLTEINSRYYGISLLKTLTRGPYRVRNEGI